MRHSQTGSEHIFLLDQILPPPSIRARIEAEREAAKLQKWARNPKRMEFMRTLQTYLSSTLMHLTRSPGASCTGNIRIQGLDVEFAVPRWDPHPYLWIPSDLDFDADVAAFYLNKGDDEDNGGWWLEFDDIDANNLKFETAFGDRLVEVLKHLKPSGGVSARAKTSPAQ
jgi:hypothetical protein